MHDIVITNQCRILWPLYGLFAYYLLHSQQNNVRYMSTTLYDIDDFDMFYYQVPDFPVTILPVLELS